jgi:hypothetical protein
MKEKVLTTSTGEKIIIYDDVFETPIQNSFQKFAEDSFYTIGGSSLDLQSYNGESTVRSNFSQQDVDRFGIFNHHSFDEFKKVIHERTAKKSWILFSSYLSKYSFHPDLPKLGDGKTFLYYINTKWDKDWGGETLFCNEYCEVEIALSFKPNRVVIFDSHIPHRPSFISADSYPHRFTFVTQFNNL